MSQAEGAQGIEATPASGAVAARWPPLLATEASASPPCPCERRARRARVKLVGRLLPLGVSTRVRPPSPAQKLSRPGRYEPRLAVATPEARPMPREARERLERALCGVLERRYPGRRFAMKDQLDTLSHRATAARMTTANTDGLKDAA